MILAIYLGTLLSVALALLGLQQLSRAARARRRAVGAADTSLPSESPGVLDTLDRWLRRTRLGGWLERELELAGVDRRPIVVIVAGLVAAVVMSYALWRFVAPLLAVVGVVFGIIAVRWYLRHGQVRRREAFVGQLPELARVLANASFAGLSLPTAVAVAAGELAEPARTELGRVSSQLEFGAPLHRALEDLNERVGSRETNVLIATLVVSSRSGGSLVTALRSIAETLEERKETRREVTTILSQAVASSNLVIVMGFGMLLLVNSIEPGTVDKMTRMPLGQGALLLASVMFVGGFVAIRRLAKVDR